MWDHMSGYGGGWMGYGFLPMGLIWLLLLVAAVVLVVWLVGRAGGGGQGDGALEILRQRYARGELDREEFERMKEELGRRS